MASLNSTIDGLGFEEVNQTFTSTDVVSGTNFFAAGSVVGALVNGTTLKGTTLSGTMFSAGSFVGAVHSGATALFTNVVASTALSGASALVTQVTAGSVIGTITSGTTAYFTNFSGTQINGGSVVAPILSGTSLLATQGTLTGSLSTNTVYGTPGSPYYQGDIANFTTETVITGGMWVTVSGAAGGASVLAKAAAASTTPLGVALATVGSNATVSVLTRGYTYLTADGTIENAAQIRMGAGGALNTVAQATVGSGARGVALAGAGSEGKALVYLW
mgnify:CR=1 FL=1